MSIRMDQPKRFDLVGNRVMIAGIGTGFEATINYRVHEGHDEVTGSITVGGGTGEHAQFQVKANVGNAAFQLDRLFVPKDAHTTGDLDVHDVAVEASGRVVFVNTR